MSKPVKHPGRVKMLKAVKTGKVSFREHLEDCDDCRRLFRLLSQYDVSGNTELDRPSIQAVEAWAAVPLLYGRNGRVTHVPGEVSFDSWSHRPALELRDIGVGQTRRVCLKAGTIQLEIVAGRLQEQWEFTARIYKRKVATSEFVLRAGRCKLLAKSRGFYHWSSRTAPRTIRLLSPSLEVDFEKLSW